MGPANRSKQKRTYGCWRTRKRSPNVWKNSEATIKHKYIGNIVSNVVIFKDQMKSRIAQES